MLATLVSEPFHQKGWVFEEKYDGYRILAYNVGKVGTGFSEERLDSLWRAFRPLVRSAPAFVDPPRGRGLSWLAPKLVAQVAYTEWTADRRLRQPVFLGLRDDKSAAECLLPAGAP